MHDLIIVGGGPSGLSSAIEASDNIDILIIEEDKRVGIPRHCTGIVSYEALKLIGEPALKSVKNKIRKAEFVSPSGIKVNITLSHHKVFVLERVFFEELLLEKALKKGVNVSLGERVKKISIEKEKVKVITNSKEYESKGIIYAASTKYKLINTRVPRTIPAIQYEFEGEVEDEECVKVFLCKEAEGFFAWYAPSSNNTFLVGLANKYFSPKLMLNKFISKKGIKGKICGIYSGRIVFDKPFNQIIFYNVALAGDAAAHVKPTTGGGLYYGILGAKITGKFFPKYVLRKDAYYKNIIEKFNSKYIVKPLKSMYEFSRIFFSLPLNLYDKIFYAIKSSDVLNKIQENYIDYHDNVIKSFLTDRKLLYNLSIGFIKDFIDNILR
ncbi:MAG: NAD(P)/FAD-dependent oxidoreductase [Thermoproteota archaeon]|jgi:digeranylgeranylglycerophospholipid reductase|nr:NAD(P)/FAD-dependent oxidoreductase [Thermoproteota archaeon]